MEKKINHLEKYTMITVLGKGGYAKVVLIKRNEDGQVFALKILKKKFIGKLIYFKNKKGKLSILLQKEMCQSLFNILSQ